MYVCLFIGALIMIFPFYWMITGAFKTWTEVNKIPPTLIPENPFNLENFIYAFKTAPFGRYFINSILALIGCIVTCSFTTILAAFAFSRLRFPGREFIFSLLLSLMMVPYEMIIITNYRTIVHWNLHDTIWALILPFMSSIFYTYILKGFFGISVSGSQSRWLFRLEVSVESHGTDGQIFSGNDHSAECDRNLELLLMANDRYQLQGSQNTAIWSVCVHD